MVGMILLPGLLMALTAGAPGPSAPITIDYPEEGSILPPEITPPAFLWHDAAKGVSVWRIDVSFGAAPAAIHAISKGGRMPNQAKMHPRIRPHQPTVIELREHGRKFPPNYLHDSWADYLYWDIIFEQFRLKLIMKIYIIVIGFSSLFIFRE